MEEIISIMNKSGYYKIRTQLGQRDCIQTFFGHQTFYLMRIPLNVIQNIWYQHDVTPHHRGESRGLWELWPPRSPNLNLLDFYLWADMKQILYQETINTRAVFR